MTADRLREVERQIATDLHRRSNAEVARWAAWAEQHPIAAARGYTTPDRDPATPGASTTEEPS